MPVKKGSGDPYSRIIQRVAEQAREWIDDLIDQNDASGSPIEEIFRVALFMACRFGMTEIDNLRFAGSDDEVKKYQTIGDHQTELIVQDQRQVAGWRVDFVVHYYDGGYPNRPPAWARLIVECDGHDFHERTKEQAARDRSRDRRAQIDGIPILRFTGSEIWRDPWGCAMQIIEWVQKRW